MKVTDYKLDNHKLNGWRFSKFLSTARTAIFKRGGQHKAIIGASKRIVLCPKLDMLCGKDTTLRKRVVWILKHITDPVERMLALKFAFDSVTLDENDVNSEGDIVFTGSYARDTGESALIIGAPSGYERPWIDWDISDVPASVVTNVRLDVEVSFAYGAGDTVKITGFAGTQVNLTNYPDDGTGNEALWNAIDNAATLVAAAADFQSTGSKQIDLGATADSQLQANLGVDFWSIGFVGSDEDSDNAQFDSSTGTTPPNLVVTYTPC